MTNHDRVSVIVGLILVGIVLMIVLEIPVRAFEFRPLGTPLAFQITGTWIVSTLLVGMSCAGTEAIVRSHPAVRRRRVRYTFPTWILPGLTTIALATLLPQSPTLLYWLLGLGLGGGVLAWQILAVYRILDGRRESGTVPAQAGLRLIAFLLALVFFASIYRTRQRSLVTATAVTFVASLIALSILYTDRHPVRTSVLYAGTIGLVLGETTWALNYWQANALTVGVLLMLLFYILIGIVQEHLRGSTGRHIIIEFLVVAVLGLWVIIQFGPK